MNIPTLHHVTKRVKTVDNLKTGRGAAKYRASLGLEQTEVAAQFNPAVSSQFVTMLENGRKAWNEPQLARFIAACNTAKHLKPKSE